MGCAEAYCIVCGEIVKSWELAPNGACTDCSTKYHNAVEIVKQYVERTQ
jgi:hypothetical protein